MTFRGAKLLSVAARAAAGVCCALVLLELLLRVLGLFFHTGKLSAGPDGRIVALCEGDSFVRGIGGRPFPDQLEELLNSAGTGRVFRVVNGGVNGSNSSAMLARLPGELDSLKPSVLLLLAGGSNHWNTLGARSTSRTESLLMHSSVYRFAKLALLKSHIASPASQSRVSVCRPERSARGYDDTARQRAKPWFSLPALKQPSGSGRLPGYYLETAAIYRNAGDLASALALAKAASIGKGLSAASEAELAWIYEAGGDFENATKAASSAASEDKSLGWLEPVMLARRAVWRGEYPVAAQRYEEAVASGAPGDDVLAGLCRAYAESGKFDKSGALCSSRKPAGELLQACVEASALSGDYSGAYSRIEHDSGREAGLWRVFASLLLKKKEYAKAREYAGKDVNRNLALAELFYNAYEQELAQACLETAAEGVGEMPARYYLLKGDIAQSSCDYKTAGEQYSRALALRPDYWGAYYAIGDMRARRGDYRQALALLGKAAALAPSEARIYRQSGRVFSALGEQGHSADEYFKALALEPFSEDLLREAWSAYSGAGRQREFFSLPDKIPGIRFNPEFHHLSGGEKHSALEAELQEGLKADLSAACALAKSRGIPVLFSSYPEKEMPGIVQAARDCGAPYINLVPRFRTFASRRDYISFDNDHPNTLGYNAMAREYAGPVLKALGLEAGK